MPWEPPKDFPLLGPFSCTYTREDDGLRPRSDGGCVHCGRQPEDAIHSEKRRAAVAALFADRKSP